MSYNAYNNNVPAQQDMCMDWDSAIETDGQEFITLEEGDYNFEITNFERGRFPGSQKIPACNKAAITAVVRTPDGIATVKFDLILYRSLEWRISALPLHRSEEARRETCDGLEPCCWFQGQSTLQASQVYQ